MEETIGVAFKHNGRVYYFKYGDLDVNIGKNVIVETEKGLQYGFIATEKRTINEKDLSSPLKSIIRIATESDKKKYEQNLNDAHKALLIARDKASKLNLSMHIIDANYLFDRKQLLFNFIAEGRVDFRELAKQLAQQYRTRIELRQIGVRDKAKEIGGIGPCGRFLCCNTFLTDFTSVSINMAKNQYISLNPTKINGVCGRLLCCLKYEDSMYSELKQELPTIGKIIDTPEGKGKVTAVNVFKQTVDVELPNRLYIKVNLKKD